MKPATWLRLALWVNIVFWLGAFGSSRSQADRWTSGIGLAFAAALQHQVYTHTKGMRSFQRWRRTSPEGIHRLAPVPEQYPERVTVNPNQCGGKPCIRGMRVRVLDVLELLASGLTPEQVVRQLPDLEIDDIRACLGYAALCVAHPPQTAA